MPAPGFWQEQWSRIRGEEAATLPHWSQAGKVDWSSLPRVYDRMAPVKSPSLGALLALDDTSAEGVLYEGRVGKGRVYLFTTWFHVDPNASLSRVENKNYQLMSGRFLITCSTA